MEKDQTMPEAVQAHFDEGLSVAKAIQISKILATAPEERLPLILDVCAQAGLYIEGMDEIGRWKDLAAEPDYIPDIYGFMRGLVGLSRDYVPKGLPEQQHVYLVSTGAFNQYCKEKKLSPRRVRRSIAYLGLIRTTKDVNKTVYSCPVYDAETKSINRYVCINANWEATLKTKEA